MIQNVRSRLLKPLAENKLIKIKHFPLNKRMFRSISALLNIRFFRSILSMVYIVYINIVFTNEDRFFKYDILSFSLSNDLVY